MNLRWEKDKVFHSNYKLSSRRRQRECHASFLNNTLIVLRSSSSLAQKFPEDLLYAILVSLCALSPSLEVSDWPPAKHSKEHNILPHFFMGLSYFKLENSRAFPSKTMERDMHIRQPFLLLLVQGSQQEGCISPTPCQLEDMAFTFASVSSDNQYHYSR